MKAPAPLFAALILIAAHPCAATDSRPPISIVSSMAASARKLPANEYRLLKGLGRYELYQTLLDRRASSVVVAHDGAVGRNTSGYKSAAFQRDVIWLVMRSFATGNADDLTLTVQAMEYAFQHQTRDGNFENTLGYDARTAVGADAFFIQAFARIYTVMRAGNQREAQALDAFKPNLQRALQWLRANSQELLRQDRKATNRLLFDAIALILGGRIVGDADAQALGQSFLDAALDNQRSNGSFNEHKGSDSSYQAVSILNLGGLLISEREAQRREKLINAYCRAVEWEARKISPDGEVSVAGNSRTGSGQETFFGQPKDVNYYEVILSFYQASSICDPDYAEIADRIVKFASTRR